MQRGGKADDQDPEPECNVHMWVMIPKDFGPMLELSRATRIRTVLWPSSEHLQLYLNRKEIEVKTLREMPGGLKTGGQESLRRKR